MPHLNRFAVVVVLVLAGCSRRPADDLIATRIKASFFSDPEVKMAGLSVAVDKGQVTLSGTVPSAGVQLQAFKLAAYTDGVVRINDQMVLAAAPVQMKPVIAPVEVHREQRAVAAPAPQAVPVQQENPVTQVVQANPELRPPGGPRTAANVRIGGLRVPLIAKAPQDALPPAEPEVVYDPAIAIIAGAPTERGRRSNGLFVAGPQAPAQLYERWFLDFNRVAPQAQLTYEAIGSGAGIQRLVEGKADLSATDLPVSIEQVSASKRTLLYFPAAIGGVVLISNLSGVVQEVNFSGDVLGAILSGRITRWSDPAIASLNPRMVLPAADISVVHRSDDSAEPSVLTDYLSKVSPNWRLGSGTATDWPPGIEAKGNDGVALVIHQTPNSLGYVDFSFALQNRLPFGTVRNSAGRSIKANAISLTAAAAGIGALDFRASIANSAGVGAYPIAGLTWLIVPDRIRDKTRRDSIPPFISWMLTQGQKYVGQFGYAPLPQDVISREMLQIGKIR